MISNLIPTGEGEGEGHSIRGLFEKECKLDFQLMIWDEALKSFVP